MDHTTVLDKKLSHSQTFMQELVPNTSQLSAQFVHGAMLSFLLHQLSELRQPKSALRRNPSMDPSFFLLLELEFKLS